MVVVLRILRNCFTPWTLPLTFFIVLIPQHYWCLQQRCRCPASSVQQRLLYRLVSKVVNTFRYILFFVNWFRSTVLWSIHCVFLLISYDEEADKVNQYQRLNLEGMEKIEIGNVLHSIYTEKFKCHQIRHWTIQRNVILALSHIKREGTVLQAAFSSEQ